jgi:hypothetical protein
MTAALVEAVSMPRQNRVTPFGEIVAIPERGTMMGNRGRLHDEEGRIRRPWQVKRWLLCVLEFRGRQRVVMAPDRYTELFFLDEATGLAAGHRPCAECRHGRFVAFREAWAAGNPSKVGGGQATADLIDAHLHAERIGPNRSRRYFKANVKELPDGVFVIGNGDKESACLLWQGHLLTWSPAGYKRHRARPRAGEVRVLTPRSIVAAIRQGYVPEVHPTVVDSLLQNRDLLSP